MFTIEDFRNEFRTVSNDQLLEMLRMKSAYRKEAIIAAQEEWESRNLGKEAIMEAETAILQRKELVKQKKEASQRVIKQSQEVRGRITDKLSPWKPGITSAEKAVRWMILSYLLLAIYITIKSVTGTFSIIDLISDPIFALLIFYDSLMLLLAAILFAFRKKIGWVLLVFQSTTSMLASLLAFILQILGQNDSFFFIEEPSSLSYLIGIIVPLAFLFASRNKDVRSVYRISPDFAARTYFVSVFLAIILYMLLRSL